MTFIPTYAPVDCDGGVTASNLNVLTSPGVYVGTNTNVNAPPFPAGQYFLEVRNVSGGTIIQQRATLITQSNWVAIRMYSSAAWGAWQLISKPLAVFRIASTPAQTIPTGAWTQIVNWGAPEYNIAGGTWSAASSNYSVPRTAVYSINAAVYWYLSGTTFTTPNNDFMSGIYVAGALVASGAAYLVYLTTGTFGIRAHISVTKILTAGQTVDLRANQNGPVSYTAYPGSFLEVIELLQATS